eukprot:TRINITY_DN24855_c1_g1_i1.p1 TRINITY_DN24855_c1_g1~~TRINITY_DN24855_c1_g1_i1.p1  ORF type:complete len:732 (+),score=263.36 TRINITY_DN24855_c1_g1_i1:69-2264(+)
MSRAAIFSLFACSASAAVLHRTGSPVDDVITLLSDLKSEVTADGEKEKATFDKFDTFCKDTRAEKVDAIKTGELKAEECKGTITSKNTDLAQTNTDIGTAKVDGEKLAQEKTDSERQCEKDKAAYEATDADLKAAIEGLEGAVEKLSASKGAFFTQLRSGKAFMKPLKKALDMAEALGFLESKKRKAVGAFLQSGKGDPWLNDAGAEKNKEDYKFQSDGIVTLLTDMLDKFKADKQSSDDTWADTKTACEETAKAKEDALAANTETQSKLDEQAASLKIEITDEEEVLINTQNTLKEDNHYLSELNENCAARTRDYEQRSSQREGEIKAIEAALGVMTDKVKGLDGEVNLAALAVPVSFVQREAVVALKPVVSSFIAKSAAQGRSVSQAELSMMIQAASTHIAKAAAKYGSSRMAGLALRMNLQGLRKQTPEDGSKSPLEAVKATVQKLVNDLLEESKAEAEKKGKCDTAMNKQKMERVRRINEAKRLNAKLESLEAKRVRLEDENHIMDDELKKLRDQMLNGDEMRAKESEENRETVEKATEGSQAVKAAAAELQAFYRKAGNSADAHNKGAFLQQEPPAADEGSYAGKQEAGSNIISLMENIGRDFDKTIEETKAAETKAADEFTKFKSEGKSMIADRETGIELNTQDLKETHNALEQGHEDLVNTMELVDSALESLLDLSDECVAKGMSYAERKAQRDAEIDDLRTALCLLDPKNAGPECSEVLAENQ